MAKLKVDLLSGKAKGIAQTNRIVRWQKKAVWGLLGLFVTAAVVIYAWWGWEVNRQSRLGNRQERVLEELKDRSDLQVRYMLNKEILFQSERILQARKDFQGVLEDAYALLPSGSVVRGVNFGEKEVSLQVSNQGVQEYAEMIRRLEAVDQVGHERFASAELSSSSRDETGVWIAKLKISFKEAL